jgi:hypothetical protein
MVELCVLLSWPGLCLPQVVVSRSKRSTPHVDFSLGDSRPVSPEVALLSPQRHDGSPQRSQDGSLLLVTGNKVGSQ